MEDQNSNVPHNHDFIDAISRAEQLLFYDENHDDPLLNDFVNGMVEEPSGNVVGNYGTQFPGICFEENPCNENRQYTDFPQTSAFGNPIQIPLWPIPPSPHSCTCCQTLREFFHIDGLISLFDFVVKSFCCFKCFKILLPFHKRCYIIVCSFWQVLVCWSFRFMED